MPAVTERIIEISILNINKRKILRQKKQPNETSEDETWNGLSKKILRQK